MWTYVKWEIRRLRRQPRFWASLLGVAVIGGLFAYGYREMHGKTLAVSSVGAGIGNGFLVPVLALSLSSSILLPFLVALFAGESLSGERQSGTWATLLAQGVNPWSLFWAKSLVAWAYAIGVTLLLTASSLFGGWVIFGLHASALPSGVMASAPAFWRLLVISAAYAASGQMVVATFSLVVGAFCKTSLSALMISMGTLIVLAMLGDLPVWGAVRRLFFPSYFSRITDALTFPTNWTPLNHGLLVYAIYCLGFLALILWFQPFRD